MGMKNCALNTADGRNTEAAEINILRHDSGHSPKTMYTTI
jgi:hypothetical protein